MEESVTGRYNVTYQTDEEGEVCDKSKNTSFFVNKDNNSTSIDVERDGNEEDEAASISVGLSGSFLSGLYLMSVVAFSVVIKTNLFLTEKITAVEIFWFFIVVYIAGSAWMALYQPLVTSCFQHSNRTEFSKSHHVNNRWLKGILALFGLAIVVKDGLEFIAYLTINSSSCKAKTLYAALPLCNILFVVLQVNFLFKYSKVFTQNFRTLSKFGLMHVIGTNLSVWIATVIDEAFSEIKAITDQNGVATTSGGDSSSDQILSEFFIATSVKTQLETTGEILMKPPVQWSNDGNPGLVVYGNCWCNSTYCSTVSSAESFLFPFVIEFSLISSCLLYMTWKNIGKTPPFHRYIIKPSYKLYGSYRGVILGSAVMFATVIVIVILGTSSYLPDGIESEFDGIETLNIYNIYYIVLETLMIASCFYGFHLHNKIRQKLKKDSEYLDIILLIICLVGPLVYGMFSVFGTLLIGGSSASKWALSFTLPLVDILQCIIQVLFILGGLHRMPIVIEANLSDEKKSEKIIEAEPAFQRLSSFQNNKPLNGGSVSIELASSKIETPEPSHRYEGSERSTITEKESDDHLSQISNSNSSVPRIESPDANISPKVEQNQLHETVKLNKLEEKRVSPPDNLRLLLRNTVMFLLVSNACLWVFLSLEGTAFEVESFQDQYYGGEAWTIISMICRPLNIFFRMHSAACLFEVWSFA